MKESPHDAPPTAFETALWRHRLPLRAGLRRRGVPESELDDVVQEVFLRALRDPERFRSGRPLLPWLLVVGVRHACDLSRKKKPSTEVEAPGGVPALEEAIASEERERVRRALRRLGRAERELLESYYREQRPIRELASELGVPLETAKSRLHRARARLARELERGGS